MSSLDIVAALEQFLGSWAGLSAATVTRLTAGWQEQTKSSRPATCPGGLRLLLGRRHPRHHRLAEERLCLLVIVGVRADGRKELVALSDGYRESEGSWVDLLHA